MGKGETKNFIKFKLGVQNNFKHQQEEDPFGFKGSLIWYTNFVSDSEGKKFTRHRYNYMNIAEEMGGMVTSLVFIT